MSEFSTHEYAMFTIGRVELYRKIRLITGLELKPVKAACIALISFFMSSKEIVLTVDRLFEICELAYAITDGSVMTRGEEIFRKAKENEVIKPGSEYYVKTKFVDIKRG